MSTLFSDPFLFSFSPAYSLLSSSKLLNILLTYKQVEGDGGAIKELPSPLFFPIS